MLELRFLLELIRLSDSHRDAISFVVAYYRYLNKSCKDGQLPVFTNVYEMIFVSTEKDVTSIWAIFVPPMQRVWLLQNKKTADRHISGFVFILYLILLRNKVINGHGHHGLHVLPQHSCLMCWQWYLHLIPEFHAHYRV